MLTIRPKLRRDLATVVVAVTCFFAGGTVSAWQSQVMVTGCAIAGYKAGDLARDDAWIEAKLKPFQPVDGKPALTVVSGETQAQVALALQEIRSVCALYRAGKMSDSDADNTLSGHEQTIRDFLDHLEHEARARASLGRAEDVDAISAAMTDVGNVGRQAALMGAEALAQRAIDIINSTATNFDRAFGASCMNQVFNQDLALGLEYQRQNAGVDAPDLGACARRLTTSGAELEQKLGMRWAHCGALPDRWTGAWKLTRTGAATATGRGETGPDGTGTYTIDTTALRDLNWKGHESGTLQLTCEANDCDCVNSPKQKACLFKYGHDPRTWPAMILEASGGQSATIASLATMRHSPQIDVVAPINLGTGTFRLEVKKVDRPCTDKDIGL